MPLNIQSAPLPHVGRGGIDLSEYRQAVEASWDERETEATVGSGKVVEVPTNEAKAIVSRLRQVAEEMDLGLRVVTFDHEANAEVPAGQTRIHFAAKVKTNRDRLSDEERAQREQAKADKAAAAEGNAGRMVGNVTAGRGARKATTRKGTPRRGRPMP